MRFLILSTVALSLVCLLQQPAAAQNQTWQTVSIPGICTYQIPTSVEIQKGAYKELNDTLHGLVL